MSKVGISQGNPLAALGNILRKGPGRGSGRDSKSPRREISVTKKSSFKGSKESLGDKPKDSPELSRRSSEPKSPKMFRFGIRRSNSRSKKGDRDDPTSDTSSVSSFNATVKEELMEAESSGLTISRSACEKEEKIVARESGTQASSVSTGDVSKSANRNSTYFKPPEVEPLTGLFDSGELDALLKTNEGSSMEELNSAKSMKNELELEAEKEDKPDQEEAEGTGSGLKRNNLRSSFRMYENRYKEETLERKKDKSPLSKSVSTAAKLSNEAAALPSTDQKHVLTMKPAVAESQTLICVNDSLSAENTHAAESDQVNVCSEDKKQKQSEETEKRRRELLEDELFQSDLSENPIRTSSGKAPSLDAYAKAHRSPSPVDIVWEQIDQGQMASENENVCEERKDPSCIAVESYQVHNENENLSKMTDISVLSPKTQAGVKVALPVVEGKEAISNGVQTKKTLDQPSPVHAHIEETLAEEKCSSKSRSEITPVLDSERKPELENVKRETECNKKSTKANIADKKSTSEHILSELKAMEVDVSQGNSDQESLNERVASRIRRRREEKEQKSPQSKRSYDSRSKIESGKVSNTKSRFDSSSPKASPKMHRDRVSTDSRKSKASEESPSWMTDLHKRREERAKETTQIKSTKGDSAGDMPDWRKRVLERRKKAEETKATSVSKKNYRYTTSQRLGRRNEAEGGSTSTGKVPQNDSDDVKKSPSFTKKVTRATKSAEKITISKKDDDTTELPPNVDTEGDKSHNFNHAQVHEEQEMCKSPKPQVSSPKPDVASPKPEIASPKPNIQVISRKAVKHQSSNEPLDIIQSPEDKIGKEVCEGEGDVFVDNETATDSSWSPANLHNQMLSDSQSATGSQKSSDSSEHESGMPFRSRGMSHSRSPTPTSMTPGPLKLPSDADIPEWKKKVIERKKGSSLSKKPLSSSKTTEQELPTWKKELLAKRSKVGEEVSNYERYKKGYNVFHTDSCIAIHPFLSVSQLKGLLL